LQGFLGVNEFQSVEREGGGHPNVDGDEGTSTSSRSSAAARSKARWSESTTVLKASSPSEELANAAAFAVGGGGAAVAVDVDPWSSTSMAGRFSAPSLVTSCASTPGPDRFLEWADYEQEDFTGHDHGSGFGYGTYASGTELVLPHVR
jgi:hypothetical protein